MNCSLYVVDALAVQLPTLHPGTIARILYVNASGVTSERTITVGRRFSSRHGVTYLRAYCHLRGEDRTFRVDRVLAVLDVEAHRNVDEVDHAAATVVATRRPRTTSVQPRPVTERSAAPAPARRERTGRGRHALSTLFVGILAVIGIGWFRGEMDQSHAAPRFVPPPAPPVAVIADTTRSDEYRGQRIATERRDEVVTRLFADADTDRDGSLSWAEIQTFQNDLDARYRYLSNGVALRPSEFVSAGGGDCEDWALMTASLLHFWGVNASIGLVESDTGVHAVALVPVSRTPAGFLEITIAHEEAASPTTYIPIDYTRVGGLSNAVGRSYTVTGVWRPDEIFGAAM